MHTNHKTHLYLSRHLGSARSIDVQHKANRTTNYLATSLLLLAAVFGALLGRDNVSDVNDE